MNGDLNGKDGKDESSLPERGIGALPTEGRAHDQAL